MQPYRLGPPWTYTIGTSPSYTRTTVLKLHTCMQQSVAVPTVLLTVILQLDWLFPSLFSHQ